MKRLTLCLAVLALTACSSSAEKNNVNGGTNNTATNNTATNNTATNNTTPNNITPNNVMTTNNASTNNNTVGPDPVVVIENMDCFPFSNDIDDPLGIDGAFAADSQVWRRADDDTNSCPAAGLVPEGKALTPYVAFRFCNDDTVDHLYDFEFLGQEGPGGEAPLDDAYLVLYQGENMPADHTQCLALNDDIVGAIDAGDSEILGLNVPAGETVIVIGTTFTFDPTDGTGTGGYVLVVSNADP